METSSQKILLNLNCVMIIQSLTTVSTGKMNIWVGLDLIVMQKSFSIALARRFSSLEVSTRRIMRQMVKQIIQTKEIPVRMYLKAILQFSEMLDYFLAILVFTSPISLRNLPLPLALKYVTKPIPTSSSNQAIITRAPKSLTNSKISSSSLDWKTIIRET